jgi:hypothetical protein
MKGQAKIVPVTSWEMDFGSYICVIILLNSTENVMNG